MLLLKSKNFESIIHDDYVYVFLDSCVDIPVCTALPWQLRCDGDEELDVCILCQENDDKDVLVMSAFVQASTVMSKKKNCSDEFQCPPLNDMSNPCGKIIIYVLLLLQC